MKKAIAIVLSALMCLSVTALASCNLSDYGKVPEDDGHDHTLDENDDNICDNCGKEILAGVKWDVDFDNPVPLTGLYPASGVKNFGKDATAKIISSHTGYDITYRELGVEQVGGDISKILMAQDKYDFMKLDGASYAFYLDGTFLDLTHLLKHTPEGRVLYQLVDLTPNGWDCAKFVDENGVEHIYGIPGFAYVTMNNTALIWNTQHLKEIGFFGKYGHELPETLSEVDWALNALQDKYGKTVDGYHALGVPGAASSIVEQLACPFEVPNQFYLDENGKIQRYEYSQNMTDYVYYMNYLYSKGILSSGWNSTDANSMSQLFAEEMHSVVLQSYWGLSTLVNTIVARKQIAQSNGFANTFENIHDKAIAWTQYIRGDGFTFTATDGTQVSCKNQDHAVLRNDSYNSGNYVAIPYYMRANARYVIDLVAKMLEIDFNIYGGEEGTHWEQIPAPAGAPAAEAYTKEQDAEYAKYESFQDRTVFVRPYSYTFTDDRSGTSETVTHSQPGMWLRLKQSYFDEIVGNSQYGLSTNSVVGNVSCHMQEMAFNAWYYCDPDPQPGEYINNPMAMSPPLPLWRQVSNVTPSYLITGIEGAICDKKKDPLAVLTKYRNNCKTRYASKNGVRYYYWGDAVSEECTEWYNTHKKN